MQLDEANGWMDWQVELISIGRYDTLYTFSRKRHYGKTKIAGI